MKSLFLAAGLWPAIFLATLMAAPEDEPQKAAPIISTELSGTDLGFLTEAARQDALLVRLSALAQTHAVTPEVKQLADRIARDQGKIMLGIKQLDAHVQAPFSGEPDGSGRKLLQQLAKLKGAKFDKEYLDALADAQQPLEAAFEHAANSSDADIKAFAVAALPGLKQQAARVRQISGD